MKRTSASRDGRVRVAYVVSPSRQFAGIESVTHEIAERLSRNHCDLLDVHVVYCTDYGDQVIGKTAYAKHVLHVRRLAALPWRVRRWAATWDVDVLVVPQVEAAVLVWTATRRLAIPVFVSHLHGNPVVEEREGTWRTRLLFQAYRRAVSARLAAIWTVSPSLRHHLSTALPDGAPIRYVPNPARQLGDPDDWVAGTDGTWRLAAVGRLSRQKGHDLLLEALAIARADLPPTQLTLVGGGPDEKPLRDRCRQLGLDDMVTFTGYTDPATHLGSADCLVFPSRWEGFGMVLVEALQFGLPLVAFDCDFGPSDVIQDPRVGELVVQEDPPALARALVAASRRPRLNEDVAARVRVAREFTPDRAVESHLAAMRDAVAATSPVSPRLQRFAAGR